MHPLLSDKVYVPGIFHLLHPGQHWIAASVSCQVPFLTKMGITSRYLQSDKIAL
jgi:hypothetical protein